MGRISKITQEQVNNAADSIVAAGQVPTVRAVLDILGAGSMGTVLKLYQHWMTNQANHSQSINTVIDADISRAILEMLARRINEVTLDEKKKVSELQIDLDAIILENGHQSAEIENQNIELAMLRDQMHAQIGKIEQLMTEAARASEQLAFEIKAREEARIELAKAELRLESYPSLKEELVKTREEAKRSGEEAAELRGKLIGIEQLQIISSCQMKACQIQDQPQS